MGISYDYILFLFTEAGNIDYCTCHICQVLLNKWMLPFSSVFLFVCKKIKKALGHLFFCPERVKIPCLWMHILRAAYIHTNQVCFIITYSSIPLPSTSHAHIHTRIYTDIYPSYYYNVSHALCACALSLSSYNLFFFLCIFLGRVVLYVTSAQYYGVLQKVTRRRRICEWTPWCVPAHRSEGGGPSADAPPPSHHPSLQMNGGL